MAHNYESRMDAVNFSLALDDGLQPQRLDQADLILVGVSRVGKTPTALYLALQYGLRVANYPLTPDDLEQNSLPGLLLAHLPRLRALTLSAERLAAIRQARYPDSRYASLAQCRGELAAAERLLHAACHPRHRHHPHVRGRNRRAPAPGLSGNLPSTEKLELTAVSRPFLGPSTYQRGPSHCFSFVKTCRISTVHSAKSRIHHV